MTGTVSASPRAPRYRNAKGQFCKACDAVPVVAVSAPVSPVLPPVIDDVPAVSAPVVEAVRVVCAPVRSAPVRRDRSVALALALDAVGTVFLLLFAVMSGPQASAHVEAPAAVHGAGHAAFRFSEARSMHLALCDRLSGKGDDGWYVEAARLTAMSGARYTARSLAVSCALASVVRPVVRP